MEQSAKVLTHRDAVRCVNGREVLLQSLRCGQRVDVLSLSSPCEVQEDRQQEEDNRYVLVG